MTTNPFKIAIIGAGPAGCTLGRLLHLSSIPFTIFESEASPTIRGQGGTLDLHTKTGLAAIKACSLYPEFLEHARFDGEAFIVTDKNLKRYLSFGGGSKGKSRGRPEIDRRMLRDILRSGLPEGAIRWGRKLKSVGEDLTLVFEDGEERGFDLVVGADGAWSKTRAFLSDELPHYSGISGVQFDIPDVVTRFPDLDKLVNRGSMFAFSDGRSVMAQQMGDGSLNISVWGARDERWAKENAIDGVEAQEMLKSKLLNECRDWAPELRKFIEVSDAHSTRPIFMLPIGFRWENKPGVTLVGDAAHVMCPFAGEGANLAMKDALQLADFIRKSCSKEELFVNVSEFEKDMFKRAKPSQERSYGNLKDMFFTVGSPRTTIERYFIRGMSTQESPTLVAITAPLVYIFFWCFKLLY